MKRAAVIKAAAAALFFCLLSGTASAAGDLEQLLKSLPTTAATATAGQRTSMVLRSASQVVRVTPAGIAATGLVTLAMMYADDQGNDVAEFLYPGGSPSNVPTGWTDANTPPAGGYPDGYQEGVRWVVQNSRAQSPDAACASSTSVYGAERLYKVDPHATNPNLRECYWKSDSEDPTWSFQGNAYTESCNGDTTGPCAPLTPSESPSEWPEDGLVTFVQENGKWVAHQYENGADLNGFDMPDTWYWVDPDLSSGFGQSHYDGSQTITEYFESQDGNGNPQTRSQTVDIAPDGTITGVQDNLYPGLTVEQAMNKTAQPDLKVAIDVPTDYARENTLSEILENLKVDEQDVPESEVDSALDEYETIKNDVNSTAQELGNIPLLNDVPNFNTQGNCPTVTWSAPVTGEQFVIDQHCGFYTGTLMPGLNFLFTVGTLVYLIRLYRFETSRGF